MRTVEIIGIGFLIGVNLLTGKKNKKFSSVVLNSMILDVKSRCRNNIPTPLCLKRRIDA